MKSSTKRLMSGLKQYRRFGKTSALDMHRTHRKINAVAYRQEVKRSASPKPRWLRNSQAAPKSIGKLGRGL